MDRTYACIMAGGVGSRFWPASRESNPKQFLDITGEGKSLIRLTFERFEKLVGADRVMVVTHEKYIDKVAEHLPEVDRGLIIGEPLRKNTGPAAYLGNAVAARLTDDPVVIMAPADHIIRDESVFLRQLGEAAAYVDRHPVLMTLGIQPDRPHTGYGYIEYEKGESPYRVRQFREKPDAPTAARFLDRGNFLWNAGIFLWKASTLESAYRAHAEEMVESFKKLHFSRQSGVDGGILHSIYRELDSISIDYLIMERSGNVCTIPGQFGWSDVGSWLAARELLSGDKGENVVQPKIARITGSSGCLVNAPPGKAVIIDGLEDYMVVDTEDVLLIYPLEKDQEVKVVRQEFIDRFGSQYS